MSDPAVTAYLTKLLCSHGGRLEEDRLVGLLDLPAEQIQQILEDEADRFPQSSRLVLAQSPLRICTRYLFTNNPKGEEEHETCPRLHLCRHYLRGQCPPHRRPPCRFSHDVLSDHNRAVLKANELIGLNEAEITILLFQNDNQLLPETCRNYNQDSCDQGPDCPRLHVCHLFLRGDCRRRFCKKSHNLLDSELLPTCRWLSQTSIQNFQMLCALKHINRQQVPREGPRNEEPRGARGFIRGRGRGRPRDRRRAGSQDLLDGRNRERRNEGAPFQWRSSSRPPSRCSSDHRSGDEDHDSDGSSDQDGYGRSKLDDLMSEWFTSDTVRSEKVRSFDGVPLQGGARSAPPTKGSVMSSRANKPAVLLNPAQPMESRKSTLPSELNRAQYDIPKADSGSVKAARAAPGPSHDFYPSSTYHAPYRNVAPEKPDVPVIPDRTPQPVYPPPPRPTSVPTVTTLHGGPSIAPSKPSTTSSTSFGPSSQYPSTQPKAPHQIVNPPARSPTKVPSLFQSSLNSPLHLSTGGLSGAEARVGPSSTSYIEFSSTKSPSLHNERSDMELAKFLGSSMARLSVAPSTPLKASLDPTIESVSNAQPIPAPRTMMGRMGSSSTSSSSNVLVDVDTPSKKLQAHVKPIIKPETVSNVRYPPTDEDFKLLSQPSRVFNYKVAQPQPPVNMSSVSSGKSMSGKAPEICLTYIWNHCKLGDNCSNIHYGLPYRWQVFNQSDWEDLPNMDNIENAYSDPNIDRCQSIDFQTMKSGSKPVRRLSTPSSVTKPPEYVLTTEWHWYWKNEFGTWTEYGKLNTESATIQSSDLETIYLSDPNGSIPFTSGNQIYIIDCREMKQRNEYFRTERDVRRRPKFLDIQNVKMSRGSTKSAAVDVKPKQPEPLPMNRSPPSHWDMAAMPGGEYMKVLVPQDSLEFTNIVAMFMKTISSHTVKRMWRVQNSALWDLYQQQKDQMRKKSLRNMVDERQLFHGTYFTNIDAICRQNFDWRICCTNSNVYGKGSYFSQDASYSHNYSQPTTSGTRTMFVARVLVGDFTKGDATMNQPPRSYDSCVDDVYNPSIFVVFAKQQVYPEYILEYEEKKKPCLVN